MGADTFLPQGIAGGLNLEADSLGGEAMILGHDGFTHIETVIVKLDHLAAVHAQEVAVARGIGEIGVVLRGLLSQTNLTDESAPDEKGEGTINRRP